MIIRCSECGKEISDKAKLCVNCGCPLDAEHYEYKQPRQNGSPEAPTLKTVAAIILVCGIILAAVLLVVGILETNFWGVWSGLNMVLIAAGVLLLSIVVWALLRASGNASTDIKEINKKI